jgi:hydrogenase-4 component F
VRPWLLPVAAAGHLALAVSATGPGPGPWLGLDAPGHLVLLLVSVLFALCSVYAVGYLRRRAELPNRIFCACLLLFLAAATLVVCSRHLGLMWVAMEATTLATAPLLYFNRTPRSLEATWKYLLIGSVGIALALLGSFFLGYAALQAGLESSLLFDDLLSEAPLLSRPWLHAAFILLLVGYGTKMGLAPVHTWKPDAYGEAPGVVGAVLAGGVTSCAFLALLRIEHLCRAAGEAAFTSPLLIFTGLLSVAFAAVFMVGQRDFKRMLAYSSVEHMGILALGMGLGGGALAGALLHLLNNALTKAVLFLSAGNIHRAYGAKTTDLVRGAGRRLPISGTLLVLGFLAATGAPPFGPFVSQFLIVNGAFADGHWLVAAALLTLLLVVFLGMGRTVLTITGGRPPGRPEPGAFREGVLTTLPMLAALGLVLLLGTHVPAPVAALLSDAARSLGVRP